MRQICSCKRSAQCRTLPLSDGLLLVLPLGRPGPRLSGSCCVPFDAVVVVVVDEEVAELLLSFFRRIRESGPATPRKRETTLLRGISCSACLVSRLLNSFVNSLQSHPDSRGLRVEDKKSRSRTSLTPRTWERRMTATADRVHVMNACKFQRKFRQI